MKLFILCAFTLYCVEAIFYLPGVLPRQFLDGQDVEMSVNKVTSVRAQLPYKYYSLPVCKPEKIVDKAENLGELLAGDRIENSLYSLKMKVDETCQILCRKTYSRKEAHKFQKLIIDEYRVHWIIDNLPAAMKVYHPLKTQNVYYEDSFPLGVRITSENTKLYYIYNHIDFVLYYHENPTSFTGSRVVGFFVEPYSIKHSYEGTWTDETTLTSCGKTHSKVDLTQLIQDGEEVIWTYDVTWKASDVPWASRWDLFLSPPPNAKMHWFSIVNSLTVVILLTGMIALIMMRTLRNDISQYNESNEEVLEETGWKLVHGDVFRPPRLPLVLAVFCGTGVQILGMTVAIMLIGLFGFLSPARRGNLTMATVVFLILMSYPSGLVASRLCKMFGLKTWKRSTLAIALFYPGLVFSIFFGVNLLEWFNASSAAIPIGRLLFYTLAWFGMSIPLCTLGCYRGFKMKIISNPARYNHIPRQIPNQPIFMHPIVSVLVGGLLPFGAVFIELVFVLSSIWLHQIYYLFGILVIVLIILLVTCAEISIVLCYFQLCGEDYNWWWRSFLYSGSSALYLFLYSIMYLVSKLDITKLTAVILYVSYMMLVSLSFFLLTGMVGFFASLWFVRKIYGAIKID